MSNVRREITRLGMQIAVNFPEILPHSVSDFLKKLWNSHQINDALYRITEQTTNPHIENLPPNITVLNLSCTSGFGETVHPKVLYVPDAFCGYKYLMSITPFPLGIEIFENPEFLVSMDGITWKPCGKSPVVAAPSDWIGYNSDPALFYENGTAYLIYRRVEYIKKYGNVKIFIISTKDGVAWTEPQTLINQTNEKHDLALMMSPSLIKSNGKYHMWYVDGLKGNFRVMYAVSDTLCVWKDFQPLNLNLPRDLEPWHIDVTEHNGKFIMSLCVQSRNDYINNMHKSRRKIIFAKSVDSGASWKMLNYKLEPGTSNFCEQTLYKPSLVFGKNNEAFLYYSGQDTDTHWTTVRQKINLDG